MKKLEKAERMQIRKALKALSACQKLIAADVPQPLLQNAKQIEGPETSQEASDQIILRLIRLQDSITHYLKAASSPKGRAARADPRSYLTQHFTRCSKPGCQCKTDPTKRHGPYWLGKVIRGKKSAWIHLGSCRKMSEEEALSLLAKYAYGELVKGMPKQEPAPAEKPPEQPAEAQALQDQPINKVEPAQEPCQAAETLPESPELQFAAILREQQRPAAQTLTLPRHIQKKVDAAQKGQPLLSLLPSRSSPKVLRIWEPDHICPVCFKKLGVKAGSIVNYDSIESPVHYACLLKLAVKQGIDIDFCKTIYHLNKSDVLKVHKILMRNKYELQIN